MNSKKLILGAAFMVGMPGMLDAPIYAFGDFKKLPPHKKRTGALKQRRKGKKGKKK